MDLTLSHSIGSIDYAVHSEESPRSHTVQFEVDGVFIVLLRAFSISSFMRLDNLTANKVTLYNGVGTKIDEFEFAHSQTERNHVIAQFHELQFGDYNDEVWHSVSLWINGQHVGTHYERASEGYSTSSFSFGFGIPSDVTEKTYYNVVVPELSQATDWGTIDPNETPIGGINRAVDGLHLKFYARYNGALRAWVSKPIPSAYTFSNDDIENLQRREDIQSIRTVVRVVGGYAEGTYADGVLISKYGDRFQEINNPYLLSQRECYLEAQRVIRRIKEASLEEGFTTPHTPFLEPEDRITTPSGERIINGISVNYTGPENEQNLSARRYAYDE